MARGLVGSPARSGAFAGRVGGDVAKATITVVFIALFALLALYALRPPSPAPINAPPAEFSSGRAMAHLRVIGQRPHPMGAAEHAAVRAYILGELAALGVPAEVQQTTAVVGEGPAFFAGGTVANILARINGTTRIDGTAGSKAILLAAHYDSPLSSPGANDDGTAVAALLETARALRAGPPLQNDVILFFTDGEESGLLGAQAFVDQHPWAREVGLVLNFEARGNSGPALMFETSSGNGRLIGEFARAAPHPFASSLFSNVYDYLPNNTDFTVFKAAGLPGLNIAYIDGFTFYHSPLDTFERASEGSLQHHGTYALSLARHFGALPLDQLGAGDAIYFDILGLTLIHYPGALALPLLVLTAALFAGVVALGLRRRQLTPGGIVLGFFTLLLGLVLAAILAVLVQTMAMFIQSEFIYYGDAYNRNLYLAGLVALILAATMALYMWLRKKLHVRNPTVPLGTFIWLRKRLPVYNLMVGALIWWLVLAGVTSFVLPGGSYLFIWPLLFALLGLGIVFRSDERRKGEVRDFAVLLICAIPALVLFVPLIYLLFVALTVRLALPAALAAALLLGLLVPHLLAIARRPLIPGLVALAGAGCLVAAFLTSSSTPERPWLNNVLYALNADTGSALWASTDPGPDEWSAQFFPDGTESGPLAEFFPLVPNEFIHGQAPAVQLAPPQAELLEATADGDARTLRVRITSPRQAPIVWVYTDAQTEVVSATVNGLPIVDGSASAQAITDETESAFRGLVYWAVPAEGIELTLRVRGGQPVTLRVVDRTDGLPETLQQTIAPRPAYMAPAPSVGLARYSDSTLVSKTFTF